MEGDLRAEFRKKFEEDRRFLSNKGKLDREKSCVAAFLRCLGIPFSSSDLRPGDIHPDVIFGDANFQVTEAMEELRRRTHELVERPTKILNAAESDDHFLELSETERPDPTPITIERLIKIVPEAIEKKANRYAPSTKKKTDLLVYVNQPSYLPPSEENKSFEIGDYGFRSISVLVGYSAIILKGSIPSIERGNKVHWFTGDPEELWKL